MPLSQEERMFLDAYVYEATHSPFGGPATTSLRKDGIGYTDLSWILTAYQRELTAERRAVDGIQNLSPPPSPWGSLEVVKRRNDVLRQEWEPRILGALPASAR
jgi:hypothetical protein